MEIGLKYLEQSRRFGAIFNQLALLEKEVAEIEAMRLTAEATNNKRQLITIDNQMTLIQAQISASLKALFAIARVETREAVEEFSYRLSAAEENLEKLANDYARSENLMEHARQLEIASGENQNLSVLQEYAQSIQLNYDTQLRILKDLLPC